MEAEYYRQPNLTYRLNDNSVAGKISGLESIEQAIFHILQTERYSNPLYNDDYGVELEQYIGQDIGFIAADIENTLREALTQDDRITDVSVTNVAKSTKQANSCEISFTVYTIYGDIEESLEMEQ